MNTEKEDKHIHLNITKQLRALLESINAILPNLRLTDDLQEPPKTEVGSILYAPNLEPVCKCTRDITGCRLVF